MHKPNDSRPQQTANRLRALVFIPAFIAVVGILFLMAKLADRFNALEEPAARDYPPNPPPRAGGGGTPLVPAAVRPEKRAQAAIPTVNTNVSMAATRSDPGAPDDALKEAGSVLVATPVAASTLQPTDFVRVGIREMPAAGIVGRVLLRGTPPTEREIPMNPSCGRLHEGKSKPTTRLYVVGTNGALADVFVVLNGLPVSLQEPLAGPVEIRQRNCEYLPYISAALVGQVIRVFNDDPLLHNVHSTPANEGNREQNQAQLPMGAPLDFIFPKPEIFLRFKCDAHPWMFAYVNVVEHPFFAVSAPDGQFALPQPPPGSYTVQFIHRKARGRLVPVKVQAGKRLVIDVTLDLLDRDKGEATVKEE